MDEMRVTRGRGGVNFSPNASFNADERLMESQASSVGVEGEEEEGEGEEGEGEDEGDEDGGGYVCRGKGGVVGLVGFDFFLRAAEWLVYIPSDSGIGSAPCGCISHHDTIYNPMPGGVLCDCSMVAVDSIHIHMIMTYAYI
jgi:hypothetical protein